MVHDGCSWDCRIVKDINARHKLTTLLVAKELRWTIQISPGEHAAEVLEQIGLTPKAAVALVSKPAEERHRWVEDLDAKYPDLGRVLRRSIGLCNTDRSIRAREVLVHYALTHNPDPCKKDDMMKAKNSVNTKHR